MRDHMIERIDEVLNDEESYSPEYLVAKKQQQFETALERHAQRVAQERWILSGVKLGTIEAVWGGPNQDEWAYVPAEECDLWFRGSIARGIEDLPSGEEGEELNENLT